MLNRSLMEVRLRKLISPRSNQGRICLHVLQLIEDRLKRSQKPFTVDQLWPACKIKVSNENFTQAVFFLAAPEINLLIEQIHYVDPRSGKAVLLKPKQLANMMVYKQPDCPVTGVALTPAVFSERIVITFTPKSDLLKVDAAG